MMKHRIFSQRASAWVVAACASAALAACTGYKAPKPSALTANPASVDMQQGWSTRLPAKVSFPLNIQVVGNQVLVADDKGTVQAIDASSGATMWQTQIGSGISAGVGGDGQTAAVVDDKNHLVAIRNGAVAWRIPMSARTFGAPLVAGGRIFVLTADRAISAYDAGNGFRLWTQKPRTMEERLVMGQSTLLTAAGGALLAGVSGRLVAFNPDNGMPLMQSEVATSRGTNEVARMADLVGPGSRSGASLCARTYLAGVGCTVLNPQGQALHWSKPSRGTTGLGGNASMVVGSDDDGNVVAWSRQDGQELWSNAVLRYRVLSAPVVVGNYTVVGDGQGYVHALSNTDGQLRNRVLVSEKSPITVAPVQVGNTAVVVSDTGVVAGIRLP